MVFTRIGRALPANRIGVLSIQLPVYMQVPLVLTVTVTVVTIGWFTLARRDMPPNPFLEYADIMPGQPRSAANGWGFACDSTNVYAGETCVYRPDSGAFSQVYIIIANNLIYEIDFTVRDHWLTGGDLALRWGRPDIQSTGRFTNLSWRAKGISALTTQIRNHRREYFRPILHVIFAEPPSDS